MIEAGVHLGLPRATATELVVQTARRLGQDAPRDRRPTRSCCASRSPRRAAPPRPRCASSRSTRCARRSSPRWRPPATAPASWPRAPDRHSVTLPAGLYASKALQRPGARIAGEPAIPTGPRAPARGRRSWCPRDSRQEADAEHHPRVLTYEPEGDPDPGAFAPTGGERGRGGADPHRDQWEERQQQPELVGVHVPDGEVEDEIRHAPRGQQGVYAGERTAATVSAATMPIAARTATRSQRTSTVGHRPGAGRRTRRRVPGRRGARPLRCGCRRRARR